MIQTIALIGAGRVAGHLGPALVNAGLTITQVYSRRMEQAVRLGNVLQSAAIADLTRIRPDADLYLLAIADDGISEVAKQLFHSLPPNSALAHTSGATPLEVLQVGFAHTGVFYPLQTFSADRSIDVSQVPFCLEANTEEFGRALEVLARRISRHAAFVNAHQRTTLHVAAVFANNFTNYLLTIAHDICAEQSLPFDLLRPLILETARKVQALPPEEAQTGPARRGDQSTLQRHRQYLDTHHPALTGLYTQLSEAILRRYAPPQNPLEIDP